jgi:hypothetical protein
MGLRWFISLCALNFFSLVFVSMLILFYLRKRERLAYDAAEKLLKDEETRLNTILDEVANISTALYGDIEARQIGLQKALREAEHKILEMKQLVRSSSPADSRLGQAEHQAVATAGKQAMPLKKKIGHAELKAQTAQTLYDSIYTLADQGRSVLDIARAVKKPKGEVELILNLRHVSRAAL